MLLEEESVAEDLATHVAAVNASLQTWICCLLKRGVHRGASTWSHRMSILDDLL